MGVVVEEEQKKFVSNMSNHSVERGLIWFVSSAAENSQLSVKYRPKVFCNPADLRLAFPENISPIFVVFGEGLK